MSALVTLDTPLLLNHSKSLNVSVLSPTSSHISPHRNFCRSKTYSSSFQNFKNIRISLTYLKFYKSLECLFRPRRSTKPSALSVSCSRLRPGSCTPNTRRSKKVRCSRSGPNASNTYSQGKASYRSPSLESSTRHICYRKEFAELL